MPFHTSRANFPVHNNNAHATFRGALPAFRVTTWNCRSIWTVSDNTRRKKLSFLKSLASRCDVVCLQGTHISSGREHTFRSTFPDHHVYFCNKSRSSGGTLIMLQKSSPLALGSEFEFITGADMCPLHAGQTCSLRITNQAFRMHLWNMYLDPYSQCIRKQQIDDVAARISPAPHLVIAGDFNFTELPTDRTRLRPAATLPRAEPGVCTAWSRLMDKACIFEVEQNFPTYVSRAGDVTSRLDRAYTNTCTADAMTRDIFIELPSYREWISDHRPLCFSSIPKPQSNRSRIPQWVHQHPSFSRLVHGHFYADPRYDSPDPWARLDLLRESFWHAYRSPKRKCTASILTAEDRISVLCALYKEMNSHARTERVNYYLSLVPDARECIYLELTGHGLHWHFDRRAFDTVLNGAVQSDNSDEIAFLHTIGRNDPRFDSQKEHALKKLKRRRPANSCGLSSLLDPATNELTSDPPTVALLTRRYWQSVWDPPQTDETDLRFFVDDADIPGVPENFDWNISVEMVQNAVLNNKSSAPGPDGVPFSCYKCVDQISTSVLHFAITDLMSANPHPVPPDITLLNLIFIPKKPSAHHNGQPVYEPSGLRPISISHCCVRLISSVFRAQLDSICQQVVPDYQSGFISGRKINDAVTSVLDEFYSAVYDKTQLFNVLIDFKNAFSSVSHRFLVHTLRRLGFPPAWEFLLESFLLPGSHVFHFAGRVFDHARIRSGARQGDPCSPLLFILALHMFCHKLRHVPGLRIQAFADDLILIFRHQSRAWLTSVIRLFDRFHTASGLAVNLTKSVLLHSAPVTGAVAASFHNTHWGPLLSNSPPHTKYLGVPYGRTCSAGDVFANAVAKLRAELLHWRCCKTVYTERVTICNIFIVPILSYLGCFYLIPKALAKSLQSSLALFVQRFWYMPSQAQTLTAELLNIPAFHDIRTINIAAALRRTWDLPPNVLGADRRDFHPMSPSAHALAARMEWRDTVDPLDFEHWKAALPESISADPKRHQKAATACLRTSRAVRLLPENETWLFQRFLRWDLVDTAPSAFLVNIHALTDVRHRVTFLKIALNAVPTKLRTRHWIPHDSLACVFCGAMPDCVSHWPACDVLRDLADDVGATLSSDVLWLQLVPDIKSRAFICSVARICTDVNCSSYSFPRDRRSRIDMVQAWMAFYTSATPAKTPRPPRVLQYPDVTHATPPFVFHNNQYHQVLGYDSNAGGGGLVYVSDRSSTPVWVSPDRLYTSHTQRKIHAFCDGSCLNRRGGIGVTIVGLSFRPIDIALPVNPENFPFLDTDDATNNISEFCAVYALLRFLISAAPEISIPVYIFLDSRHVLRSLLGKDRGRRLVHVRWACEELYREARSCLRLYLFHIFAHAGHYFNERADQLASRALAGESFVNDHHPPYGLASAVRASQPLHYVDP